MKLSNLNLKDIWAIFLKFERECFEEVLMSLIFEIVWVLIKYRFCYHSKNNLFKSKRTLYFKRQITFECLYQNI